MHIVHPFLDKRRLRKMFDHFIERYSTGRSRAAFAVGIEPNARPMKRQRSNGGSATNVVTEPHGEARGEPTERSPGNAIIYLVLALGKICSWKEPLPSIVSDSKLRVYAHVSHSISESRAFTRISPLSGNIRPSPLAPNVAPTTLPFDSRSRRASAQGSPSAHVGLRNLDVIPSIAYYAKAAEILGEQGDGNDLVHAQMFLLAGLYKGQLARVKESMSWFSMAGRAICSLLDRCKLWNTGDWDGHDDVRSRHTKAQSLIKDTRASLIVLASWTCLQLETDILADIRLPTSSIDDVEEKLSMPGTTLDEHSYKDLELPHSSED